jgi:hypothetical protein
VNFVAQFLDDRRALNAGNRGPQQQQRNVSATTTYNHNNTNDGRGGGGRGGRGGRGRGYQGYQGRGQHFSGTVKDQYYKPEVWSTMTPEQQEKARQLCADRDSRRGVQVLESRRTRQRTDTNNSQPSTPSTVTVSTPTTQTVQTGVGSTMSQRSVCNNL